MPASDCRREVARNSGQPAVDQQPVAHTDQVDEDEPPTSSRPEDTADLGTGNMRSCCTHGTTSRESGRCRSDTRSRGGAAVGAVASITPQWPPSRSRRCPPSEASGAHGGVGGAEQIELSRGQTGGQIDVSAEPDLCQQVGRLVESMTHTHSSLSEGREYKGMGWRSVGWAGVQGADVVACRRRLSDADVDGSTHAPSPLPPVPPVYPAPTFASIPTLKGVGRNPSFRPFPQPFKRGPMPGDS